MMGMEGLLQQILNELKSLNGRVSNIEAEVTSIKSDVSNLKSDVSNLKSQVTNIETRVTNIETNMATKDDVADIPAIKQAVLEASEKINEVVNGQERQDKILESLSLRSLEQESELRALKRIK
jgi:predicted  nucleic acid-binding Zn-ribbon protein